jgi:hypothetical protein
MLYFLIGFLFRHVIGCNSVVKFMILLSLLIRFYLNYFHVIINHGLLVKTERNMRVDLSLGE